MHKDSNRFPLNLIRYAYDVFHRDTLIVVWGEHFYRPLYRNTFILEFRLEQWSLYFTYMCTPHTNG
jgi:hypothetical protein